MMPETKSSDNFYMAICKKGFHSYVIIGRVKEDGEHEVLLRVGKQDLAPQGIINKALQPFKMLSGVSAMLVDEELSFGKNKFEYKAFDINFQQLTDFYRLIAEIQSQQKTNVLLKNEVTKKIMREAKSLNWNLDEFEKNGECEVAVNRALGIETIVPYITGNNKLSYGKFELNSLAYELCEKTWPQSSFQPPSKQSIIDDTATLTFKKNCRKLGLKMLEWILGSNDHGIPNFFATSPGYIKKPNSPLYILPPPPGCSKDLEPHMVKTLQEIFKRLEAIPQTAPEKTETKEKFDELKKIYLEISNNKVNIAEYLGSISNTVSNKLYQQRKPFLSKLFGLESETKKLFKKIKENYSKDRKELGLDDASKQTSKESPKF